MNIADKVLEFMGEPPFGPWFRCEVETFLAITGSKAHWLGYYAVSEPSFVSRLRRGASPRLPPSSSIRDGAGNRDDGSGSRPALDRTSAFIGRGAKQPGRERDRAGGDGDAPRPYAYACTRGGIGKEISSAMASDGGPRAWAFLRRNPVYRAAWRAVFDDPEFEAAPFPVRIQSMADRHALAWGLLARENPHRTDGSPSPFWAEAPMLEGEWGTGPRSLAALLAHSAARVSGLRLADGTLILKIENCSEAAQVRIGPGAGPETGAELVLNLGLGQAKVIAGFKDLERLTGCVAPDARQDVDRVLLQVLDGRLAGKSWRETAVDVYGAKRVTAEWHADGWMRARVRRRGEKARILMEGGYRDLVAGR